MCSEGSQRWLGGDFADPRDHQQQPGKIAFVQARGVVQAALAHHGMRGESRHDWVWRCDKRLLLPNPVLHASPQANMRLAQ